MKKIPIHQILALSLTLAACKENPNSVATPLSGQVYRSFDGQLVLTLISHDECELRTARATLLCKYTKQSDALRVVATDRGTNQVLYYRFTNDGVQDDRGTVLLAPDSFAAAMEQARIQQMREDDAQRDAERARLAAENHQRAEQERVAALVAKSKQETRVVATIPLRQEKSKYGLIDPPSLVITDVSIRFDGLQEGDSEYTIYFRDLAGGHYDANDGTFSFHQDMINESNTKFYKFDLKVASKAQYQSMIGILRGSMKQWEQKFADTINKSRWDKLELLDE